MQRYQPYRQKMLTHEQLRELSSLRPKIAIRDTILHWGVIVCAWSLAGYHTTWWSVALAVIIIGTQYYALLVIAHDGLHRRLFNDAKVNDLWCDGFILGAIGAITRLNRRNHMTHHAVTCQNGDPDRFKYTHPGKQTAVGYALFLSGVSSVLRVFQNIFIDGTVRNHADSRAQYTLRDIFIVLCWQCLLIGGLSLMFGWWGYPVLWLLPVYLFGYRADLTRVFTEHSMLVSDDIADASMRLITYTSNPLERAFFAPHNMNLHAAHHLWPAIPYYNLPAADRLVQASPLRDENFSWRSSYLGYVLKYAKEKVLSR